MVRLGSVEEDRGVVEDLPDRPPDFFFDDLSLQRTGAAPPVAKQGVAASANVDRHAVVPAPAVSPSADPADEEAPRAPRATARLPLTRGKPTQGLGFRVWDEMNVRSPRRFWIRTTARSIWAALV